MAMSVSSRRTSSARPIERQPKRRAEQAATRIRTATPSDPLGNVAPTISARTTMISDWIAMVSEPRRRAGR